MKIKIIFVKGFFSYEYHSNLVYDCKLNSFKIYASSYILDWKPKNTYDPSNKNELSSTQNINNFYPSIKNISGELYVCFTGNYFVQDIVNISNNVINIYCVYKLDPIDFSKILQSINTKDMVFVLAKVRNLLTYEKKLILIILLWLET